MSDGESDARSVVQAADSLVAQLRPAVDNDWSTRAGALTWSVREVIDHLVDVCGFYSIHLAARSPKRLPVDVRPHLAASNDQRLDTLAATARLLASTVVVAEDGATGWHFTGPTDASGFAHLACNELLVHGWDAAQGLALPWQVDEDLCERTLRRTFSAASDSPEPWLTLLSVNGRDPDRTTVPMAGLRDDRAKQVIAAATAFVEDSAHA